MVWILLALLGVPLWFLAGVAAAGLWSRRAFKRSTDAFPAKVRTTAGHVPGVRDAWPWQREYARWVHGVLLVHRGLALARHTALPVAGVDGRLEPATPHDLPGLGPSPVVLALTLDSGATVDLAGRHQDRDALVGPYAGVLL